MKVLNKIFGIFNTPLNGPSLSSLYTIHKAGFTIDDFYLITETTELGRIRIRYDSEKLEGMTLKYLGYTIHPNFPKLNEQEVTFEFQVILGQRQGKLFRLYADELDLLKLTKL